MIILIIAESSVFYTILHSISPYSSPCTGVDKQCTSSDNQYSWQNKAKDDWVGFSMLIWLITQWAIFSFFPLSNVKRDNLVKNRVPPLLEAS